MRRGAPLSEGKAPVSADIEYADVESMAEGGGYDKTYKAKQSPSSGYGLSIPAGGISISLGGGGIGNGNGMVSRASSHSSLGGYSTSAMNNYSRISSNMAGWNRIIYSYLTKYDPETIKKAAIVVFIGAFILFWLMPLTGSILICVYAAVAFGVLGSLFLSRSVLFCDDGTEAMRAVSDPIREGAEGFLSVQYSVSTCTIYLQIYHKYFFLFSLSC